MCSEGEERTIVACGNTVVNAVEQPGVPGFVGMSLQFRLSLRVGYEPIGAPLTPGVLV